MSCKKFFACIILLFMIANSSEAGMFSKESLEKVKELGEKGKEFYNEHKEDINEAYNIFRERYNQNKSEQESEK